MRPDDALALLREHDPLADGGAALNPAAREALRRRVAEAAARPRPRPRRSRGGLLLVGIAILLAVSGSAVAIYDPFNGPEQHREEVREAAKQVPLPPGVQWKDITPREDLPENSLFPVGSGLLVALERASCAWLEAWDDAYRSGDLPARRGAERGLARIIELAPRHPEGAPEDVSGWDKSTVRASRRELARARAGDPTLVRQDLRANCGGITRP
jgi:hypothetical protein